jgi:hypothetical protein
MLHLDATSDLDWQPYDPAWLVEAARQQAPLDPWIADALAACTRAAVVCPAQLVFVDPATANEPDGAWKFRYNLELKTDDAGDLVLDILEGPRIGGVEFLDRLAECPEHYG